MAMKSRIAPKFLPCIGGGQQVTDSPLFEELTGASMTTGWQIHALGNRKLQY